MNGDTISLGGMLVVIICVYILFMSVTTTVTGSLWVAKTASEELQDIYNIVLYSVGNSPIGVRNYILNNPQNVLTPEQIDLAFARTPSIIFKNITPSNANKIITDIRKLGSLVDAV